MLPLVRDRMNGSPDTAPKLFLPEYAAVLKMDIGLALAVWGGPDSSVPGGKRRAC